MVDMICGENMFGEVDGQELWKPYLFFFSLEREDSACVSKKVGEREQVCKNVEVEIMKIASEGFFLSQNTCSAALRSMKSEKSDGDNPRCCNIVRIDATARK